MRAKLTNTKSIPQVISELTLDEKLNLVGCYRACHTYSIPDMDIPSIYLMDGATGLNGVHVVLDYLTDPAQAADPRSTYATPEMVALNEVDLDEAAKAYKDDLLMSGLVEQAARYRPNGRQHISFPSGINIGAAFDQLLAENIGRSVGIELRNAGIDVCFGPNVDIARDPLGGRNYEMYGEDPELVAQTSASFIRGMQSAGVAACAKHFIANNQETNRNTTDAHLSKRTLMEIYSRGFEAAIHQGDVKTVMSAYNAINGEFTSYSRELLTDLLRNELGFKGAVVSDWGAASENKEDALAAGLDLIQSGPNDMTGCKQAIIDGRLAESVLDERVGHILKLILDIRDLRNGDIAHYNSDELLKIACNTVIAGSVLLKNENNTLPIEKEAKVAFFGQRSKNMLECGSGSTAVATALHSNVYEEFQKLHGPTEFETMDNIDTLIYTVTAPAGENVDREGMVIEADDLHRLPDTLRAAKQSGIKTIVLLNISGPVEMNSWLPWADAVLSIFVPGCMGGVAAAELLTGLAAPGGKLPVTFPVRYQDTPSYPNFPGEHNDVYYGEGIFVGYRSYAKREIPVQFPFGFGMSYTAFEVALDGNEDEFFFNLKEQNSIEIPVRVKNIGKRSGSEVVQIYVREKIPRVLRPVKELAGYAKVNLNPGEEQVVNVKINKNSLRYYDARMDKWINPIGEHSLLVGTSSEDIIVEARLNVIGDNPYPLSGESTIIEIMKNPAAMTIVNQFTGNMFDKIPKDTLDFMLYRKLNDILSVGMVQVIPDTVKLAAVLNTLYDQLAKI